MEACCGAHYLGQLFAAVGHDVRLMSPEYVRPYVKAHKNDDRDAEGIAEAATRPTMRFAANAVRLQLHALAYNLANLLQTTATPELIERWSLPSLRERLIKTGARLMRHGRYAIFQMAEAAIPRDAFAAILNMINTLRGPPPRVTCA